MTTIFISSTCHDLSDLRDFLDYELKRHGFSTILSEKGTVPLATDVHSYEACLRAAKSCDVTLGVIGGRFGGAYPGTDKSITQMEIETAISAGRRVFVVARNSVLITKEVLRPYTKNGIAFLPTKVVEDERVFRVVDDITRLKSDNWIHSFDSPRDILEFLAVQLGFKLMPEADEGSHRLNRIVASKFLDAFSHSLVSDVFHGLEIHRLRTSDMDLLEESWWFMLPSHLRFCDKQMAELFDVFMNATGRVVADASLLFRSGIIEGYYTDRYQDPVDSSATVVEMRDQLMTHAATMIKSWNELVAELRNKYPEVLAKMLTMSSSK